MTTEPAGTPVVDVERLARVAGALWRTALIGGVDQLGELFARMHSPRIGDLVVEHTGRRRGGAVDPDGVGFLRDTWAPLLDPADRTFLIEPLHRPGETVTWGNAEFFAVPDRADLWAWVRD